MNKIDILAQFTVIRQYKNANINYLQRKIELMYA
jgi:hypothetical protein